MIHLKGHKDLAWEIEAVRLMRMENTDGLEQNSQVNLLTIAGGKAMQKDGSSSPKYNLSGLCSGG